MYLFIFSLLLFSSVFEFYEDSRYHTEHISVMAVIGRALMPGGTFSLGYDLFD